MSDTSSSKSQLIKSVWNRKIVSLKKWNSNHLLNLFNHFKTEEYGKYGIGFQFNI